MISKRYYLKRRRSCPEFQATTRGTASQAIKALEARGYLVRQRSKADGRSVTLRLNDKGKKAAEEQTAMHDALHQMLTTVAASGARRRFEVLVRAVDALDAQSRTRRFPASGSSRERFAREGVVAMDDPRRRKRMSLQDGNMIRRVAGRRDCNNVSGSGKALVRTNGPKGSLLLSLQHF